MSLENHKIEIESAKEKPAESLLDIYDAKNNEDLGKLSQTINNAQLELSKITEEIGEVGARENLDWLLKNNNRIDLYQITAAINGEKLDQSAYRVIDEMDLPKARQFLAYRKIRAALLTAGEINNQESINLLVNFIEKNCNTAYLSDTAIDSLAKNNLPEAKERLLEIIDNPSYGFEARTRAILASLRAGNQLENKKVFAILRDHIEDLGENLCDSADAFNIIEVAGLMSDKAAAI